MNRIRVLSIFLTILLGIDIANATDFKSYKGLTPIQQSGSQQSLGAISQKPPNSEINDLIHENLNKNWQKSAPNPNINIKLIKPYQIKGYQEGTGTRGGGSGLLVKRSDSFTEVQLLEIFRSEHLAEYNLFFPIDSQLKILEKKYPPDEATQLIFRTVLDRISSVAPNLAAKINTLYKDELPFEQWIPIYDDLPLIDDEIEYPLENNTQKVQIAHRKTHYIMYNTRAYSAMSPLNRAALWLHEYLYALSGSENSIKTQRAVSLFFSSDFLSIASDIPKLTQLFFDLKLLAISRKSISGSLPPGAKIADKKQIENCGLLTQLIGSATSPTIEISLEFSGFSKTVSLDRSTAFIVLNSYMWSKMFLAQSFPIYKYPGHRILPDRICLDSSLTKVTQVQSSLAIDEELSSAAKNAALAEVQFYQAKSALLEAQDQNLKPANATEVGAILTLIDSVRDKRMRLFKALLEVDQKSYTPFEKLIKPKILGEYNISIE